MTSPTDDEQPNEQPNEQPSELPVEPSDEAAVRRLLADARSTGPVPAAVESRLDTTLAELVAERSDGEPVAPTIPLAGRRRRTASLLLAAAAVVVGGVAVGGYLAGDRDEAMDAASSGAGADRNDADHAAPDAADNSVSESAKTDGGGVTAWTEEEDAAPRIRPPAQVPQVRPGEVRADVMRLQQRWLAVADAVTYASPTLVLPHGFHCGEAHWGKGVLIGVSYDGRPAIAAFRAPNGQSQVVDVLQCGTGDVLRSTTIVSR